MTNLQEVAIIDKYARAALAIRQSNFEGNIPFLILSEDLPDGQSYLEYPDGHIELQEVYSKGAKLHSKVLRVLNEHEANLVRIANGLL